MRIAIWYNLPSGGAKRALYYHIKGLKERGHEVVVWSPPILDKFLPLTNVVEEHIIPLTFKTINGNGLYQKIKKYTIHSQNKINYEKHCKKCAVEINNGKFDIFIDHGCAFIKVPPMGKYINTFKLLYLQEPYRWFFEAKPRFPWLALDPPSGISNIPQYLKARVEDYFKIKNYRVRSREEYNNIKAHDLVLVNSLYSRESVLRAHGINSKVCYLGVDTDVFYQEDIERENTLISVGALCPEKNTIQILKAIAMLPKPRPKMIWVANNVVEDYYKKVLKYINENEIDVEFKFKISDDELRNLYSKAIAFLYMPVLEPFGLAPLEANACGLPVITIAEGGMRETIIDNYNGIIVEDSPEEMACAIKRIVDDKILFTDLSRNSIKHINKYWTLENSTTNLEKRVNSIFSLK